MNAERDRLDKKNAYEKERRQKQYWHDWHKQDYAKKKQSVKPPKLPRKISLPRP